MSRRRLETLVLFGAILTSGMMSVYFGQDTNWDLRNYHYYNAYSFLHGRLNFDIAPAQIQSFYNPILDVPFYWMMNVFRPVVYGFFVGGLHGLNIWFVYKIAYALLADLAEKSRRLLSLAAAFTGYFGAAGIMEVGTSFHDNVTSILVLAALYLVVSRPDAPSKRRVVAAGLLIGFATGLKLVVGVYALPFALCWLVLSGTWRAKFGNVARTVVAVGAGALLSTGFWLIELWRDFASPLFPYYNKIFKTPYYVLTNFFDDRFFPRNKYQVLFYPFYFVPDSSLVNEDYFRDIRMALCYLLLLLFFFIVYYRRVMRANMASVPEPGEPSWRLNGATRFVLTFFVISYVLWEAMFSIYRYLIPLELLAPVFILMILRYIFPYEKVLVRVSVGAFGLIIVTLSPIGGWHRRQPWSDTAFDIRVPAIARIAQSTVVVADDAPFSYIIPAFPETTRFVSVRNNFMSRASHTKLQERARSVLSSCGAGDLYLLYKGKGSLDYGPVLADYGLAMRGSGKLRVVTRFDDDLYLIPLARSGPCVPGAREQAPTPRVSPGVHETGSSLRDPVVIRRRASGGLS
jgi:hypothetical protein